MLYWIRILTFSVCLIFAVSCSTVSKEAAHLIEPVAEKGTTHGTSPIAITPIFAWPVIKGEVTDTYGKRRRGGRIHQGLDIAGRKNTPVYAAEDGKVIWRGRGRGYGHFIELGHQGGWTSRYAHLNRYRVKWGQYVKKGELIGNMGRTGRATGTHLHFEIRKEQKPMNPLALLIKSPIEVAEVADTGIPSSPERTVAVAKDPFRSAYLNGPVVWLF